MFEIVNLYVGPQQVADLIGCWEEGKMVVLRTAIDKVEVR